VWVRWGQIIEGVKKIEENYGERRGIESETE
jgi:hypothetical protein